MKLIAAVWVCGLMVASAACTICEAADQVLVYQVEPITENGNVVMKSVLKAVEVRLHAIDVSSRASVRTLERNRIQITVTGAADADVERIKRVLAFAVGLEIRVLANKRDHATLIDKAVDSFPKPLVVEGKLRARWVPVGGKEQTEIGRHGDVAIRNDENKKPLALIVKDSQDVTSKHIVNVGRTVDNDGHTAISFALNEEGGRRLGELTGANQPSPDGFRRRLGIIVGGQLRLAPSLMARIGRKGIISGRFTDEETESMIAILHVDALPARLKGPLPIESKE
ncbi:MAG: hypothetical protein CMJ48_06625 [Planctomycetaceae bacterium]|nr:hypothetical protein [Planctomycetaceae bacterium]